MTKLTKHYSKKISTVIVMLPIRIPRYLPITDKRKINCTSF